MKFGWGLLSVLLLLSTIAVAENENPEGQAASQTSGLPSWERVSRRNVGKDGSVIENQPWWSPELQRYSLGYETALTGVLNTFGQNAVLFGAWQGAWGVDFYFGYTRDAGSWADATTTADNNISNGRTLTTAYTGTKGAHTFVVGVGLKQRVIQSSWFQLHWGPVVALTTPSSVDYAVGTRVETFPSRDSLGNKTIQETGWGTTKDETNLGLSIGPRIGTEFYLKWFPHLSLGFATGILATVGAETTSTATTRTRTVAVVNGEEQTPAADSTSTGVTKSQKGLRGRTFGLGGTSFSFTGIFTIRYLW